MMLVLQHGFVSEQSGAQISCSGSSVPSFAFLVTSYHAACVEFARPGPLCGAPSAGVFSLRIADILDLVSCNAMLLSGSVSDRRAMPHRVNHIAHRIYFQIRKLDAKR